MTLVMWNDHKGVINQKKLDQDVADEVSGKVDFRGKVMCSEKLLVIFTEEKVDGRVTTDKHWTLRRVWRQIKSYKKRDKVALKNLNFKGKLCLVILSQ